MSRTELEATEHLVDSQKLDSQESASAHPQQTNRTQVTVSIVIPCFNEEEALGDLHQHLLEMIEDASEDVTWEFVLVDDGSTDGTQTAIQNIVEGEPRFHLVTHATNRGLIAALQTGFSAACGRWVACLDADCTYSPLLVNRLLEKAEEGFDCVTASPYHAQGKVENVTAWRIALSRFASVLYGTVMRSKLSCYTCCVRIYDRRLLTNCKLDFPGFVGVTELLYRLNRQGARIGEIPAVLRPRTKGVSKMRTLSTTWTHLKLLSTIAYERLFHSSNKSERKKSTLRSSDSEAP